MISDTLDKVDHKGVLDESTITETWRKAQEEETVSQPAPNERPPLSAIINLNDFEEAFAKTGSAKSNAYIAGGSNDHITLEANKSHWSKLWFQPRVMVDVSRSNTQTTLLHNPVTMPVYINPMGIAKTAGPEGETALAAGAAASGIMHMVATPTSFPLEDILASVPASQPFFYQVYVDKQRHKTEAVLRRLSQNPQIKAFVLTADLAVVSKREADERLKTPVQLSTYQSSSMSGVDNKGGGVARTTGSFIDPALNWNDIAWARKHTHLPLFVKGVQSAADAKRAAQVGCQGIVVSNHGGRALDNAPPTCLVLLEMRRDCPEVFEQLEVFVDGGIRRGSDVLKAVCLGAKGVGIGRPFQCAVAYGREGVEHCAGIVLDELETAMKLCGVKDLEEVRGDMRFLNTSELEMLLPQSRERWAPLPGKRVGAKL